MSRSPAPGPQGDPILGSLRALRADPIGLFAGAAREHGDVVRLRLVQHVHLINHPDHFQHVLQENHRNYTKGFGYDRMEPLIGKGLLTSEGELWRKQRKLAQPAFHKQRIAGFAELIARHTEVMLERWDRHPAGHTVELHAEMMRLAFTIVCDALFSVDLHREAESVGRAFSDALEIIDQRFQSLFVPPAWLPSAQNRRLRRAVGVLDDMVNGIIAERLRTGADHPDLLGMLMAARDEETGAAMDSRQLRDEVITMILAGHETTANTLTWLWSLLSRNPAVERKLHAEIDGALGERVPALADLPALKYTASMIEETLRLYPPVWLFGRRAIADDVIGGFHIPAGGALFLCPYLAHRDPRFWDNPEGFDPERFSTESAAAPRFSHFPFALGPRMCIGAAFATMEMQIVVANGRGALPAAVAAGAARGARSAHAAAEERAEDGPASAFRLGGPPTIAIFSTAPGSTPCTAVFLPPPWRPSCCPRQPKCNATSPSTRCVANCWSCSHPTHSSTASPHGSRPACAFAARTICS
jgi:cytochrome P450